MKYTLGSKLFILGSKVQTIPNLIEIIMPFLLKLSQITKETINLGILEDRDVICLNKIESPEALRADIEIGEKLPASCSAIGKSLLACLSKDKFQILYNKNCKKLPIYTKNSISSIEELKKCLEEVRRRGYSTDLEELKTGINCLGVSILNIKGEAIAGISITGPSSRFNLEKIKETKNTLLKISKEITEQLGK